MDFHDRLRSGHPRDLQAMNIAPMPVTQRLCLTHGATNRRRYTRRNRWCMIGLLIAASLLLLMQCAPRITPVPLRVRVVPAKEQKSASPALTDARKNNSKADAHNAVAASKINGAKSGMQESHTEMQSLVIEVGRLKTQRRADANELLNLYNRLVAQEKKFLLTIRELDAAEIALAEERALRKRADESVLAAEVLVHARDAEAAQLRIQFAHAEQVADNYEQAATRNAELAAKAKAEADKSAGVISLLTKILIGVSIALLISLGANILLFRATFRI